MAFSVGEEAFAEAVGTPFGPEVVVAVACLGAEAQGLADEAGQPYHGQVEPSPQLAVDGVPIFVSRHFVAAATFPPLAFLPRPTG